MKNNILTIGITMLLILSLSGCIDDKDTDELNIIYVNADGGRDFTTIQEAIDNAKEGYTIYVENGNYQEKIVINKSISLIGTNKNDTIISFNESDDYDFRIVSVDVDNCIIESLKIINTNESADTIGIDVKSSNNLIYNNTILNNKQGIWIRDDSSNNRISFNNIFENHFGIVVNGNTNKITSNNLSFNMNGTLLFGSESNEMFRNIISNNDYGIRVVAYNNTVYGNLIENNQRGMYFCCGISGNIMYLNSFKGNKLYHAADYLPNQWDSGTLGNYWDDFDEADEGAYDNNGDGIVDEPYSIVGESNVDRFPLMESTWY